MARHLAEQWAHEAAAGTGSPRRAAGVATAELGDDVALADDAARQVGDDLARPFAQPFPRSLDLSDDIARALHPAAGLGDDAARGFSIGAAGGAVDDVARIGAGAADDAGRVLVRVLGIGAAGAAGAAAVAAKKNRK